MKTMIERRFVTFHAKPKEARDYVQKTPEYKEFERVPAISIREDKAESALPVLEGYAAMFEVDTEIMTWFGSFRERISRGAFDRAIKEKQDVRALRNHDPDNVLGRTSAKTLKLSADRVGLKVEIEPPNTSVGRDTVESIRRGDITGQSFAFIARKVTWINGEDGEPDLRVIEDVDLYDVGPVTYPAYPQTSIDVKQVSEIHEARLRETGRPIKKRSQQVEEKPDDGDPASADKEEKPAEEKPVTEAPAEDAGKAGEQEEPTEAPPPESPKPDVEEPAAADAEHSSEQLARELALARAQRERLEVEMKLLTEEAG